MSARKGQPDLETTVDLVNEAAPLAKLSSDVLQAMEAHAYPPASVFAVRLALEEAVANAFKHGCRGKPGSTVRVSWTVKPDYAALRVEDPGDGFDPGAVPDPTAPDRIEIPGGRGLLLMRAYMTSVEYSPAGNAVTMVYRKP